MQPIWKAEQVRELIKAKNPRDFLSSALSARLDAGKKISYASLARSAGFASRSYPRDVLKGLKFLTQESAQAFSKALKLTVDLSGLFSLLVEKDNFERKSQSDECVKAEKKISNLRRRIQTKIEVADIDGNKVYSITDTPVVYASLGSSENGSSFDEILTRSGLAKTKIALALEHLIKLGLSYEKDGKFFATANHVGFEKLRQNGTFQKVYVERLKTAIKKAENDFNSNQSLFMESTFSVSKEKLPVFKKELRELVVKFIENQETPEGNGIASFACSLFLLNP